MANPNDATFHARITADAQQFIQQTEAASAALARLVADSGKVGVGEKAANTRSGENEAKKLGAAMRAEQEKTTRVVQDNIKEENRLRAEGVRAAGLRPSQSSDAIRIPEPPRLIGPAREGALGAADTKALRQGYIDLAAATRKYGGDFAVATANVNKGLDTTLTNVKKLSQLEGPVRSTADTSKLRAGLEDLNRQRMLEREQVKAILEDRKRMAAVQAAAAREDRKQMDAMVTGRYALYDLSEAYMTVAQSGLRFLGLFKQAVQTAAEFETAFTSVEGAIRPLPGEVDALRQSLIELTQEIPLSFTQISEIATLGAQMGVAAGDIESFTKTVASFSAITGASIDETAESFGRISSLADVPVDEFENLASAITYAGVNAVATEEQILTLTQSIAASSRQAGFSADEIVGLATALASLGIQPEQARGVLIRVFGAIGAEIDKAGEKLEVYSKISGMSAEDIKQSWGSDPKVFFGAFLQGLSQVENKTQAFTAAGFVDTREINVLQKLSQNMDVYNSSLEDAIKAYGDGSYLGERYAMTIDNLASKIIILQSNLAAFGNAIGSALEGPLKGLIDVLSFVLVSITKFAQTPLGGLVVAFAGVSTALVTGFTLIAALGFKATAQLFAMRTAMIQMGRAGQNASGGIIELIRTMTGSIRMVQIDTMVKGKNVVVTKFMTKEQAKSAGVLAAWTAAAGTATVASRGLTLAIRALGIASGVLTGLTLVGIAAEMLGMANAAKKLEGLDFASVSDAVRLDTEKFRETGEALSTFKVQAEEAGEAASDNAGSVDKASLAHEGVETAVSNATTAIDDNTVAFGENTAAAIRNSLANNKALQETFESYEKGHILFGSMSLEDEITRLGGSFEELIEASVKDPGNGAIAYLKSLGPEMYNAINAATNPALGGWNDFTNGLTFNLKGDIRKEIADIAVEIDASSGAMKSGASYASLWGVGITDATEEGSDGVIELKDDVNSAATLIAESFNLINKEMQLQEAINTLGKSLKENGKEFDTYSEGGRENIKALQGVITGYVETSGSDANLLATNLQMLMQALGVMGVNSATALNMVTEALRLSGGVSQEVTQEALGILVGGLTNVTTSAGSAQSALEKLQGAIDKTFAKLDRRLGFQDSLSSLRDSLLENGSNFSRFSESGRANIGTVRDMIDSLAERSNGNSRKFSSSLNAMKKAMIDAGLGGTKAVTMINKAIKASGSNAKASAAQVRQFANALRMINAGNVIAAANAINNLSDSVMNYLNARWMLGNTQMEIAAGWEDIANSAADAREEVEDISDEIAGFAADRGILEYQLGIAIKYGDELRANQLRAEIEELNQREADLIEENQRQQREASGGATPAADLLKQQQALQQMVGYYVQMGAAEVISAKNKKDAKAAINETVDAFKEQAREAGVSEENIKKYAGELRKGLKLARELNKPAEYKINARTEKALNEIRAFRDSANAAINSIQRTVTITVTTSGQVAAASGGLITGQGSGTSDSIPARLSNGEYVVRAAAVKTYGTDFMNSINQMKLSSSFMPSGGAVATSSGSSVVFLSPEDRNLLRQAIDRPINLYSDSTKIAQTANQGNVILAQRGTK